MKLANSKQQIANGLTQDLSAISHKPLAKLHIPVMLEEVIKYFEPASGKKYLDATLGAGGHTLALLEAGATVVGLDRDQVVIDLATSRIKEAGFADRFQSHQGSFADLLHPTRSLLVEPIASDFDGILFDLGVSSVQLDTPERGFSFRFDAPLDMRMDPSTQQVTAKDLINGLGRKELYELFTELGEERASRRLADTICDARKLKPIETTLELAGIIETVVHRTGHLHPATKVFQALRMAVNTERDELKAALPSALSHLRLEGVLAVISFHSGEDKLVKSQFVAWEEEGSAMRIVKDLVTPTPEEIKSNPRSRSAKLRVTRRMS